MITYETELKPCPFCGGEATIIELSSFNARPTFFASCGNCGAEMPRACKTREQAIQVWNRRRPKMTNFERIKVMTLEEFTSFLMNFNPCPAENDGFLCGVRDQCRECVKKYLESKDDEAGIFEKLTPKKT